MIEINKTISFKNGVSTPATPAPVTPPAFVPVFVGSTSKAAQPETEDKDGCSNAEVSVAIQGKDALPWPETTTNENKTNGGAVGLQRMIRPSHVPEIGGCPPDCGHSDEEHIAFDVGVYDGEHGTTIPPVECCEDTDRSRELREAWLTGHSVGVTNRPNVASERQRHKIT